MTAQPPDLDACDRCRIWTLQDHSISGKFEQHLRGVNIEAMGATAGTVVIAAVEGTDVPVRKPSAQGASDERPHRDDFDTSVARIGCCHTAPEGCIGEEANVRGRDRYRQGLR
jgi:hypothetical protein